MSLVLGRGSRFYANSMGQSLTTVDGAASFTINDDAYVMVDAGHLLFATATVIMTAAISSESFKGQLLANFAIHVNGLVASFTDLSFSDMSGGAITAWAWTFGDGGTSTVQNPEYSYAAAGQYSVALTVTNASGNTSTANFLLIVNPGSHLMIWDVNNWDQNNWNP